MFRNWYFLDCRMVETRLSLKVLQYKPTGTRTQGRPLKIWMQQL